MQSSARGILSEKQAINNSQQNLKSAKLQNHLLEIWLKNCNIDKTYTEFVIRKSSFYIQDICLGN